MEFLYLDYELMHDLTQKVTRKLPIFSSYDESAHYQYNMDEGDAPSGNAAYVRQESARLRFSQRK